MIATAWEWHTKVLSQLHVAVAETLGQSLIAFVVVLVLGLPIGLVVYVTAADGVRPQRAINRVLAAIVNFGRAIPTIVLIIALMQFTRFLLGSSIGWQPAAVPLAVGTVPFFARLAENALRTVSKGTIEAALMAGASRFQAAVGVALREALPALIGAVTVTAITVIGFSAITGPLGGGGLGSLVYNYGYARHHNDVILVVVVIFYLVIQGVQMSGDALARKLDHSR